MYYLFSLYWHFSLFTSVCISASLFLEDFSISLCYSGLFQMH